jgi:hypothetical protein
MNSYWNSATEMEMDIHKCFYASGHAVMIRFRFLQEEDSILFFDFPAVTHAVLFSE